MAIYMLDTNMASHVMRGDIIGVRERLIVTAQSDQIAFSVISQAELFYGLAKRGKPKPLKKLIEAFLNEVEVMPWTPAEAKTYGELRAACEASGISLATADMMIAAHAKSVGAILVTRDTAFTHLASHIVIEDWSRA